MAKSKARFLSELLGSTGLVKKSKSELAGADEVLDLDTIPTIPNSKLANASISIAGHSTALGESVALNTGNITEHTNYKYFTDARARGAVSVSGDLAYNSSTGVLSFTERTDAEVRGLVSATGSLSYNSSTGAFSYTTPTTIASLSNHDTADLTEGTNLYFTTARARSAISATGSLSYNSTTGVMSFTMPAQNTSNITEGTNLYFTNARADARIAAASTSDLSEGTNLYFTNARADARITAALIDEDNMSSNSATRIPSQQSVKAYVDTEVAGIVDSAPGTLNTLNELAAALGDDANFSTTVTNSIATKLPLAGGTMTGAINMNSNNLSGINNATAVSFLSTNGYWVGGTQRMNGSGDLVNIGTISSGAITSSGQGTFTAGAGGQALHLNSTSNHSSGTLNAPGLLWREADGTNIAGIRGYVDTNGSNHLALGTGWFNQQLTISPVGITVAGTISSGAITSSGDIQFTSQNHKWSAGASGSGNNILGKVGNAGAAGIVLKDVNSVFRGQLYADGTNYGFLNAEWGSWDFKKTSGGALYLNNNSTYYLQPDSTTNLNNLTVAGTISSGAITSSGTVTASGGNSTNWNTAYGWGNHASAGYLTGSPTNLSVSGYLNIGTRIGTVSPGLSITGDTNSTPIIAKAGHDTMSILPWDNITYIASGTYYDDGTWVHASTYNDNALLGISGNTGGRWYATTNGVGGSWNTASDVQLWNNSGVWTSSVNSGSITISGNTAWHAGNDGIGSGLDADLLDGMDSTRFISGTGTIGTTVHTVSNWDSPTKSGWYSDDAASNKWSTANWSSIMHVRLYDSNNSYASQLGFDTYTNDLYTRTNNNGTWTSWDKIWHAGVDGSGSGLDADLLDGLQSDIYFKSYTNNNGGWSQSNRNFSVRTGGDAVGLHMEESDGTFGFQLYGNGSQYGFLDAEWGNWDIQKATNGELYVDAGSGLKKVWHAGNDGSGSGLDADLLDGQQGSYYQNASNINAGTLNNDRLPNFVHLGTSTSSGYATDDGNWGSRLNVSSTIHAKIEVSQEANSMRSHWYAHTGQDSIKFGTSTGHDVELQRASGTKLKLVAGGSLAYEQMIFQNGGIGRADHHRGNLVGSYNNVAANSAKTNPIYVIGTAYQPTATSFSGMYGVGYAHNNIWGTANGRSSGWGFYSVDNGTVHFTTTPARTWSQGVFNRNGYTVWDAGNDGSGSTLDADLLDGQHGSYYFSPANYPDRTNFENVYNNLSSSTGASADLNNTFLNDRSGNFDCWGANGAGSLNHPPGTTHVQGIQVRHQTSTDYGWQIAGQYNIAAIWKRQVTNGSFSAWAQIWTSTTDGSGSGLDADLLDGYNSAESGGNTIHKLASNGYSQINNWTQVGTSGIYSSTNSAHFNPNTTTSYGSWRSTGSRGGYDGIMFDSGGNAAVMFDAVGNGGVYQQGGAGWHFYYLVANTCLGVNGSTTSSSYALYATGGIYSTANIVAYSDRRVKENITPIDNALEKVNQLEGVYYNRTDDPDKKREIGFIAQDVNEVTPELVTYAEDVDQYGVKYQNTTALLVEAVKQLTQQVKDLKTEIEELKNA